MPAFVQVLRGLAVAAAITLTLAAQQFDPPLFQEMRWRCIGPFRAGRTVAVSGVPGKQNVYYMAPNNGGVWKSIDYGRTWKPIFDKQPTGSVGWLVVAPSDTSTIYVGSGEGLQRPDLSVGDGMYKSTDAGATWTHLGLDDAAQIPKIIVDPRNENRVFVAVLGHPYGPNTTRGVYRSLDGGATWKRVLYKDENTGAVDLEFDPHNPQKIYAALWAGRQAPWEIGDSFRGPGSGLFVSEDGGDTWRPLTKGLPTFEQGLGRIGFDIAPGDSSRMYAMVDAGDYGGVYRSGDAGESWRRVNHETRVWGRGDDFACVRVDPRNKDVIYVANTSTYKSADAGHSFTAIKGAPGGDDYHTIWINPENPDIMIFGVDQGATLTVDGGKTWSSWYNQPTAQFYHVVTDNRFPYWVYGGQQESGSAGVASRSDFGEISFRDWHPVAAEEYGYIAPDPLDPNIIYGGKATRFNQTTGEVQDISPAPMRSSKYRFVRTMPLLFSPVDPHILYLGGNVLFKTTNGGHSWSVISPDLSRERYEIPPSLGIFGHDDPEHGKHRGVIYTIAPSFKDVNLLWAGTDDGLIWITRDGGAHWKNVTPPELTAWSKVSLMEASHFDTQSAYAAINRFRCNDMQPYIYRTHDGGKTWTKITNGIPDDEVVNAVREDPERKGLLYAGSEHAVYVSFDDGGHWQSLRLNMPVTSIRDLVIHGDDLVVGTHGRSFWILDDVTPLRQIDQQIVDRGEYLFRPEAAWRWRWNKNTDTPLPPEEPAGKNPPDGATLNYYLKTASTSPVTLEVLDRSGHVVRKYSSADQPVKVNPGDVNVPMYWVRPQRILSAAAGLHRFIWDMHTPPPDSLFHEYPIAAIYRNTPRYPLGAWVLPGIYTVKLTVDGRSSMQPLTLKMDPRVKTPVMGLVAEHTLATRICAGMNGSYEALQQVNTLRAQLKQTREGAGQNAVTSQIDALDKKAAALLGGGGSRFAVDRRNTAPSFIGLNLELETLLDTVDGVDATPTTQATAAVDDALEATNKLLAAWREIEHTDVPALNSDLKKAQLPELNLKASAQPLDYGVSSGEEAEP